MSSASHYLFGLTAAQPTLLGEAQRLRPPLGVERAAAQSEDVSRAERVVRRLYLTEEMSAFGGWEHLRTVLRVESETFDVAGRRIAYEERYFLVSLPSSRLTPAQWPGTLVRLHWGVETAHQILDVAFAEKPVFHPLAQLDAMDVADLLQVVRVRVLRLLERGGVTDPTDGLTLLPDDLSEREPALAQRATSTRDRPQHPRHPAGQHGRAGDQ